MLDRPLWPVGQGLTSKRLGNNLKVVKLGNRIEKGLSKMWGHRGNIDEIFLRGKRCFCYFLDGHVISNDLLKMLSMTSGHKYWLYRGRIEIFQMKSKNRLLVSCALHFKHISENPCLKSTSEMDNFTFVFLSYRWIRHWFQMMTSLRRDLHHIPQSTHLSWYFEASASMVYRWGNAGCFVHMKRVMRLATGKVLFGGYYQAP